MTAPGTVVAIVGPTASGKSSLAERVAVELGTSVISVDAMQVYRGMDIGTAKEPPADRRCPLLMVDVANVDDDYSVALFQEQARHCADGLLAAGKTPVLCGGTGLYLDSVIDEMEFPHGATGGDGRRAYEEYAQAHGADALHALLQERDAASAEIIHPNNVRRVVRALEMLDEGTSYAQQHAGLHARRPHYQVRMWGITMDRSRLYDRINQRVDKMFLDGLVDEVVRLRDEGLSDALTAHQAIGYKEVLDALSGATTMDEAREEIKLRSRRYAKRQLSWLRRDGRVMWLDYDRIDESAAAGLVLDDLAQTKELGAPA
jgi:tRNA dimethylallyltransferase